MGLSFHRQELRLRRLLRLWAVIFAAVAGIQIIQPGLLVEWLNLLATYCQWQGPALPVSETRFYSSLGVSLLVVLIVLCWRASQDVKRRGGYVRLLLLSKWVSTGGYLFAFLVEGAYFAYLVGAIADGSIALITYALYRRVSFSTAH